MLKIRNLKKYFGGVHAVNDCSFDIKKGSITALIGPNGSGKTTVFNLISGIISADEGSIVFNNEEITQKNIEYISNLGVSRVFQQSRLFLNLTVKENLLLAMRSNDTKFWRSFFSWKKEKEEEKKFFEILKLVDMETHIEETARYLSFGQKRLVELARAILNPHVFLMLDEPVGGVSPYLREKIKKILNALCNNGETIFLIEHDMPFVLAIADNIVVLDAGKVIANDVPEKIRQNKKVLEAYIGE